MGNLYQTIMALFEIGIPPKTASHILIVEDNADVADLYKRLFVPLADNITIASSVEEAFEVIDRVSNGVTAPNILFLDWNLKSAGDGAIILRRWVSTKRSPVCVITGALEKTDDLYVQGVYNAFQKPVENAVITTIARSYVKMVHAVQAINELRREIQAHKRRTYLLVAISILLGGGPNFISLVKGILLP